MNKKLKKDVVYQIYPKSFQDSNGDGIGDIPGIISRLDYLAELGIDYIWLTPFFPSPQNDNGYDVADYYRIDERYGTMEDFKQLVQEAKMRDIELMLDMVFNHTSTEHEWFQKALQGDTASMDCYFFVKKEKDRKEPPTDWISKFGGSAWEYVTELDAYYLHLFDRTQADLNWENEKVRREAAKIVRYWMGLGVKGFRFDVVNLISKTSPLQNDPEGDGRRLYTDGPHVHEYLKELNQNSFGTDPDCITVGEMSSTSLENCVRYGGEAENELSMVFNFHHLKVDYLNGDKWALQPFDFPELKRLLSYWQTGMQENSAWNALFWCNHDQPRALSRFGDDKNYPVESAKMLAAVIHTMRGTPFIYQGEELGMTNACFDSIKQYRDVESLHYYQILKEQGMEESKILHILRQRSRDNARTPMQWDGSSNAGFTEGTPWINVNQNFPFINAAENRRQKDSIFQFYKKLIALRKEYDVISEGSYELLLPQHTSIYAFARNLGSKRLLAFHNFYGCDVPLEDNEPLKDYRILLCNYDREPLTESLSLRPYETLILYKNGASL